MGQQEIKDILLKQRQEGNNRYYSLNQISQLLNLRLYNCNVAKSINQLERFKILESKIVRCKSNALIVHKVYRAIY